MNSIDELLLAEATKVDFKVALEEKKPKSWFKSISACIMKNPNITRKEMAEKLGCSDSTVKRPIEGLMKRVFLKEKDLEKVVFGLCIYNWHKKLVAAGKLYNHL